MLGAVIYVNHRMRAAPSDIMCSEIIFCHMCAKNRLLNMVNFSLIYKIHMLYNSVSSIGPHSLCCICVRIKRDLYGGGAPR